MHVVVVGCGRVGAALATFLSGTGHSVAVIDKRPAAFLRLPPDFPGRTITGFGFDRDQLAAAGIEEADAVAAVTSGDNSNILVARIARENYGVERVVARIYDPGRAAIYQRLGIPTVATVAWTTDQVLRRLFPAQTRTEWAHPTGDVVIVERALARAWVGKPLAGLDEPGKWRLAVLTRLGEACVPGPSLVGQEGDVVMVTVAADALADLEERLVGEPAPAGRR
jgi:trk system potassium uptake protein TrkA